MATANNVKLIDHGFEGERYAAKNVMKKAGEYILDLITNKLPQAKRSTGKPLDGKIYSAIVSADAEMSVAALQTIATKLTDQLIVDEAFVLVPLLATHAVEKEELINNGILRVVHRWEATTSRMLVAFEIAAGREPAVEVELKVTRL